MKKFNREKALNKIEMKKKSKKYAKYLLIGIPCLAAVTSVFYFAYAKFSDNIQAKYNNENTIKTYCVYKI